MEITENACVKNIQIILDNVSQIGVDTDLSLPDYCPDIEKILKCSLTPKICNINAGNGNLEIDGVSVVKILYCDDVKHNIRTSEQTIPFNTNVSYKTSDSEIIVRAIPKTEFINCRALSPRRVVIHGAFSLKETVYAQDTIVLNEPQDDTVEVLRETIPHKNLSGFCSQDFTINETVSFPDKPPIECLLKSEVKAYITDQKAITDKIMLSGEVNMKLLYLTDLDSGETQTLDYVFPISEIIDCKGITDETINCVSLNLLSYDVRTKGNATTETQVLIDCKLCASVFSYMDSQPSSIVDCYSTKYQCDSKNEMVNFVSDVSNFCEKTMLKVDAPTDKKISKVIDISSENISLTATTTEQSIVVNGTASFGIIALDDENMPFYHEHSLPFTVDIPVMSPKTEILTIQPDVKSISYRISDSSSLEIRAELVLCGVTITKNNKYICQQFDVDTEKPFDKDGCPLSMYFAEKDERLWNIAKHYKTKISYLKEENGLAEDMLEDNTVLFIRKV